MSDTPAEAPGNAGGRWSQLLFFLAALLIGGAGGWLFAWLGLPLPWLLGSMVACTVAALLRAPITTPRAVRPPMVAVIGVLLGAGFSADLLGRLGTMIPTLLGLVLFAIACGLACTTYLRRVAGFDLATAFFAGMPGGLIDMVVLGEERGGDARTIALVHSARIALLVFALPFLVQVLEGVDLGPRAQPGASVFDASWTDQAWLVGTAAVGVVIGKVLRFPAWYLTGPLLASAVVHMLDLTDFVPSTEVVNLAQLVLGTFLGCSFVGTAPRQLLRVLALSLGTTAILLTLTIGFAFVVSQLSEYRTVPLILAYSPGGLAEMSLIALALQIEVAFVVAHHIARVFLVVLGAALVFRLVGPGGKPKT